MASTMQAAVVEAFGKPPVPKNGSWLAVGIGRVKAEWRDACVAGISRSNDFAWRRRVFNHRHPRFVNAESYETFRTSHTAANALGSRAEIGTMSFSVHPMRNIRRSADG